MVFQNANVVAILIIVDFLVYSYIPKNWSIFQHLIFLLISVLVSTASTSASGETQSVSVQNASIIESYSFCSDGSSPNWVISLHEQWDSNLFGYEQSAEGFRAVPVGGVFIFGQTNNGSDEVSAVYQAAYRTSTDEVTFDYIDVVSPEEGHLPLNLVRWWSNTGVLMIEDGYSPPRALNCEYRADVAIIEGLLSQFEERIGISMAQSRQQAGIAETFNAPSEDASRPVYVSGHFEYYECDNARYGGEVVLPPEAIDGLYSFLMQMVDAYNSSDAKDVVMEEPSRSMCFISTPLPSSPMQVTTIEFYIDDAHVACSRAENCTGARAGHMASAMFLANGDIQLTANTRRWDGAVQACMRVNGDLDYGNCNS